MSLNDTFSPGDLRRATAFLAHAASTDFEGMAAIWAEAAEVDSWPGFSAGLCAAFFEVNPTLRTERGVAALRELARAYAALEAAEGDDDGCDGDG